MNNLENLFELIKVKNVGIYTLEKNIGLARGSISNWMQKKAKPSVEALSKIADYFDVTIDYLLAREKPQITDEEKAAGYVATPSLKLMQEEYDLVIAYRDLGKKKGGAFQLLVREHLDKLLSL